MDRCRNLQRWRRNGQFFSFKNPLCVFNRLKNLTGYSRNRDVFSGHDSEPDAQRKAQAELEAALGHCTAPRLADRPRLPYTEALISEILRTYTIGPIGLLHVSAEDDVHNGLFIPKNSIMPTEKRKIPWTCYSAMGVGRVCPGVHLADTTMWLLFASILTFFGISAPLKDGLPVLPSAKFLDGSISHPEPFACQITPRKGAEEVIRRLSEA
ncbi:cytochrome P450 [Mycena galericulata]|nr:cytochrome P450 [Mycena galericulata]